MSDNAAQIAKLRRQRQAAKGKAQRAADRALSERLRAAQFTGEVRSLSEQIVALGGKVRS